MSPKPRSTEKSKLRMDDYSSSNKVLRQKGVLDSRREIDKVIKKARKDGTQSAYWTKKLLEVEEKEPDRWRHSGFKELYVNNSDGERSSTKGSPVKKRSTMYSPSAPTSPVAVRSSRRSSSNTRRNDRRSVSSDLRRDSSRPRTDKFSSSTRARTSTSPIRRAAKSPNRSTRSPARRSRSPVRRNRSPIRRLSPAVTHRNRTPSRTRKSPVRRAKSPVRSARGSAARNKSPVSRHLKADKAERRNRSVEKVSPSVRRKKSPKLPRYKSPGSRSPINKSPIRRRSKPKSRSPLPSKSSKRKNAEYRMMRIRGSSSSESGLSSESPCRKKTGSKQTVSSDVLSSSDCSDSNCSMCRFEKSTKEKRAKKSDKEKAKRLGPPPEPKLKPRAALPRLPPPMSSRYARSKSFTPVISSPVGERRVETKHKKKSSKKEKKKAVKASKAITTSIIHHKKIKVESPSDESESPSPKRITLSERFGKMAKWNQKKDVESNQRNIRVTAGDKYRVEELDVPLLEPFPEPSPMLLDGSWEDVRVRYAFYKDQGYLEDLTFQDYLKWEEWWYSYQEWLDTERLHSTFRRRL